MAFSPNILAISAKRSVGVRHAVTTARRSAARDKFNDSDNAVRDPYGFLAIPLDEAESIGGEWRPGIAMEALRHGKTDRGWGGWEDADTPPWAGNQETEMIGAGGIHVNDRRRETIAAQHYLSTVGGNLVADIGGDCDLRVKNDLLLVMDGEDEGDAEGWYTSGEDVLRVRGDAETSAVEKMVLGACNVERRWEGAILRMIGMEGIICAGVFLKTFSGGISTTMAPLVSGDIYGGAFHGSAIRFRVAGTMGYRSSEMAAWGCSTYLRKAWTTIEPLPGSLQQDSARPLFEKIGRILMGTNPILDIMWGITFMPMAIYSLIKMIKNFIQKKQEPADPPHGPPRTRTRIIGGQYLQTAVTFKI